MNRKEILSVNGLSKVYKGEGFKVEALKKSPFAWKQVK